MGVGSSGRGAVWERGLGILNTIRDATTNTILAILGSEDGDVTESSEAEWTQHIGFASRPSKPTKGVGGPQAVILRQGSYDVCIGSRDTRCNSLYASLDFGEFCVYAPGTDGNGQARVFGKNDGSVFMYTRAGNSTGGAGMTIGLDATNNAVNIINGQGYGIVINSSGITLTAGASSLKLGSDGSVSLVGTAQTQVDGTSIVIGSLAVPVVNAALRGPTGIGGVPSLKVVVE